MGEKSGGLRFLKLSNWKIRTKLVALLTAMVVVTASAIVLVNYTNLRTSLYTEKGNELSRYGHESLRQAEEVINGSIHALKALSLSPNLRTAVERANLAYTGRAQAQIDAEIAGLDQAWSDNDPSVDKLVADIQGNAVSQHLTTFIKSFPDEVEVFATDIQGLNVGMTDRTGDYLQADEGWWIKAFNGGKGAVYIGDVEYDESSKAYAMNIGIPIMDAAGSQAIGVLRGTVDVSVIFQALSDVTIGKTGHAVLLTDSGQILYSQDPSQLMTMAGGPILEAIQVRQAGWSDKLKDVDGNPAVIGFAFMDGELKDSLKWIILVDQDLSEVNLPITALLLSSLVVGLVTIVLMLVVGVVFTGAIVGPLNLIAKISSQLAEGDTHIAEADRARLAKFSGDASEIGVTGSAFTRLLQYLQEMVAVAQSIADNDMTVNVAPKSSKDQLGNAFANMLVSLRTLIGRIIASSNHLAAASAELATAANQTKEATNQIAGTIGDVSKGVAQQSASISQTAASVDQMSRAITNVASGAQDQAREVGSASGITSEISAAIQQVAANAQAVTRNSANASESAKAGASTVNQTIQGMQVIRERVNLSAQKVEEMGRRSSQIGAIVETIEDIASQTNLLALNAAIEAARAGEHGKGFAVVADEVRKLAERASSATKEIGALIKTIQTTVTEAVSAMEAGAKEVENGVGLANQAGDALADILSASDAVFRQAELAAQASSKMSQASNQLIDAMDAVSAVVEENTAATEEMSAGASELSHSIENIASVSEENSAAIEEITASTEEVSAQVEEVSNYARSLDEMAAELQQIIGQFRVDPALLQSESREAGKSQASTPAAYPPKKSKPARPAVAVPGGNGYH